MEKKTLTKKEFLQQYVLNKRRATDDTINVINVVAEAELAWIEIERICRKYGND